MVQPCDNLGNGLTSAKLTVLKLEITLPNIIRLLVAS